MWLKGDKQHPSLNYSVTERKGTKVLLDEVKYIQNGKSKSIVGYDYVNPDNERAFTWKGKGVLALAQSKWEVKLMDKEGQWAVIWFSKTLFTPEGVDIISRSPSLDTNTLNEIKNKMQADNILKKHVGSIVGLGK